jgi:hypothetical protein
MDAEKPGPNAQRKAEIMIWIDGNQQQPQSSFKSDYKIDNSVYALYSRTGGWLYAAFILRRPLVKQHSVDAKKLMDLLKLDPNWYIPGIEFGNEIWNSSGKIEIKKIAVTLNGNQG